MSRIGKQPIEIPEGVKVKIEDNFIIVKGPKGGLKRELPKEINVEVKAKQIIVNSKDKSLWGLWRTLIANMIEGVKQGFEKKLEIVGVGYRAKVEDNKLILNLGFSHPVEVEIPKGIEAKVEKNIITILGIDKQLVGQIAAYIRTQKKPEPYKGKGIRYLDEEVKIKPGKKAVAAEGIEKK